MVLAHEGVHVTRKDHFFKAIGLLTELFWYFWPPMKILTRELESEMELSCDQHLLISGFFQPRSYGELLLRLSSFQLPAAEWSTVGISNSFLRRRIESMKNVAQKSRPVLQYLFMISLIVFSVSLSSYAVETPNLIPQAGSSIKQDAYMIRVKTKWGTQEEKGGLQLGSESPIKADMNGIQVLVDATEVSPGMLQLHVQILKINNEMVEEFTALYSGFFERKMEYKNSDVSEVELKIKRM